jgi:[ribosomal protein S18]-alanine N-acetyltransferase
VTQPRAPFNLRPMRVADLPAVMVIENQVFPAPWPADAYVDELTRNELSRCYALETGAGDLIGYGCFWLLVDEAHISTLAVAHDWRRRGLGELLVIHLIEEAIRMDAAVITLEVRVSNHSAQSLYAKYGLTVVGRRKRYYADNREDALIMSTVRINAAYQEMLAGRKAALLECLESRERDE